MSYNLFLDDERHPVNNFDYVTSKRVSFGELYKTEKWIVVRNFKQFTETINNRGLPDRISFDHDLGEDKSGYDCCKWLSDYCLDNHLYLYTKCCYHTANIVGMERMEGFINNIKKYTNELDIRNINLVD